MPVGERYLTPAVILVPDRTLSGEYSTLFEGIFATMQTTQVPEIVMRRLVCPPLAVDAAGRAVESPLGLRRVESALLKSTALERDELVCTTPEALAKLLGPWVKVVLVSSSDPLGMGMSNTTTTNFWKGELYSRYWTRRMLEEIGRAKDEYNFKVVGGGAGAWQWVCYDDPTARRCIDVVFEGYFERVGPKLIAELIEGKDVEAHVSEKGARVENIQPIRGAAMLGVVELSRGCGRGCRFCSMSRTPMEHVQPDTILADMETNLAGGRESVVSASEDFFRYGSADTKPDFDKLHDLLSQMRRVEGLSFMQIDHANITSVLQLTDDQLVEVRRLLTWRKKTDFLWVNMGVESANGHLVSASCPGKIAPFRPDDWAELVVEAAEKMTRCGFFSVFSIVFGLPGETPDDIARTLSLVEKLGQRDAVVFPIFYEPTVEEDILAERRFALADMRLDHLDLYRTCYEINFKQVPRLFWDNQRAGGVSLAKRLLMQSLGKHETASWRRTFRKVHRQIVSRGQPVSAN